MTQSATAPSRTDVERVVREILLRRFQEPGGAASSASVNGKPNPLVVNISARHVHLSQEHVEVLFGKGAELEVQTWLYQDGYFAAKQTVAVGGTPASDAAQRSRLGSMPR